jgi:uncharacterized protein (DUF58 family)
MATATQEQAPPAWYIDPKAVMAIKNFELRAKVIVEGFWNGLHRSPYHGFSVEFTEYRQYTPGDDPRYLDWRLYGRSDRYFIKKFEDETNLRCYLIVDQSRSMGYGSLSYTKCDYGNTVGATLAYLLQLQGDAVGLLSFADGIREFLPPRYRPGHLRTMMLALDKKPLGEATDLEQPIRKISEIARKRGVMVLISDFLAPLEKFEREFLHLAAAGHQLVVFQILDPTEQRFTFGKSALFEDSENKSELFISPESARKNYLEKFEAHRGTLKRIVERVGGTFLTMATDQPIERGLLAFLQKNEGKSGRRR